MAAYQKPDIEVVVFSNDRKKHEKAPDETGTVTFNKAVTFQPGDQMQISLWSRTSKGGRDYKSGSIAEKWEPKGGSGGGNYNRPQRDNGPVEIDF